MKQFLKSRARYQTHDGWALRVKSSTHECKPLRWTVCTTREEARELRAENGALAPMEIVKVRIVLEPVQ